MNLLKPLIFTNGKLDGAKITGWTTVGTTLAVEIRRVFFDKQPPQFGEFAAGMSAGAAMIAGGNFLHKKADSQFGKEDD